MLLFKGVPFPVITWPQVLIPVPYYYILELPSQNAFPVPNKSIHFLVAGTPCQPNFTYPLFSQSLTIVPVVELQHSTLYRQGLNLCRILPQVITKQWHSHFDDYRKLLNLPQMSHFKRQKLSLCYRIVTSESIIPPNDFMSHPCPHLRHNYHLPLHHPRFRTTAHKPSYSVTVISSTLELPSLWPCVLITPLVVHKASCISYIHHTKPPCHNLW